MKNKIKIALFILIVLILIILVTVIKSHIKNNLEYGIRKYANISDYTNFIDNNIYKNKTNVIKLSQENYNDIAMTLFSDSEVYINIKNNTIYKCNFTSGCVNSFGSIYTGKIEKEKIDKILLLEDEKLNYEDEEKNSYWTLEYKDKKINIVNIPEDLMDIFDVFYETVNN